MKKILFATMVLLSSISIVQAQKTDDIKSKKKKLYVKVKDGAKPDIYVDGKKFEFPMELIDQDKIKTVFVIKGENAIAKYKAPNGVILITTETEDDSSVTEVKLKIDDIDDNKKTPLIIINGKASDKKTLDELKPYDIEKMEVLKGEKAIKKYNSPNGVIIITLKKK